MQDTTFTKENQKTFLYQLLGTIVLIVVLNRFAFMFYWYSTLWWFDILMHFLGGFFAALLSVWIFTQYVPRQFLPESTLGWIILVLLSVFVIGFAWELYELGVDVLTGAKDFGYLDAFSDLWNDLSGACISLVFIHKGNKNI